MAGSSMAAIIRLGWKCLRLINTLAYYRITITYTIPKIILCWMPFMLSVERLNAVVPIVVAPSRFICSFVGNFSNYFPIAFLINIGGLKKKKNLKQKHKNYKLFSLPMPFWISKLECLCLEILFSLVNYL